VPTLDATSRARLPDSSFAYIDSQGRRRLPINDASHVRNALARFDQTGFEDDAARERARQRLLRAAKRFGIVPLGFFDGQLRKERLEGQIKARSVDLASLPRGTVTFLLTDIEGSTKLLERLGDGYVDLLRDVRALIRTAVRRAAGHEVDARADEFFAVFSESLRALDAALAIQRELAQRSWPTAITVRVRIGMHTGRPTLSEAGYVGIAVNTAARICSASQGGHILISAAAHEALASATLDGVTFRSIGRHALPGLEERQALFLVRASGLPSRFAGLRATAARRR
jgi:class 3 adenylate cyclase